MSSLRSGDLFANRFEIDRVAGAGGMGTVYRARDQLSGDFVALKLMTSQGTSGGDSERFAREAQILAELRHPGIVAHVAHGQTHDGRSFLAMQWLDGEDLAQRLARGPLALHDALTLTRRIAQTLAFAHQHGIIHRDLKPTNLFLPGGDIDRAQILDFGIARRLVSTRAMTRTGMIVGTPEYMAPEQARGVRELTAAADLFSLGCILYECLTGDPPFVAEHIAAVLVRILFEEPAPLMQRRPGIPNQVSDLLGRLLDKDPARRLGDASQVAEAVAMLGELAELPMLPTLPAGAKSPPPNPGDEQILLSLVLALSPPDEEASGTTVLPADVRGEIARRGTLLSELRPMGAQADLLLGGALVATMPQMASAKDQAALAARCAAKVKEHWPEAQVVVVTGRGSRSRGGLTGEVLDRAWRLLDKPAAISAAVTGQIRVDEVSAGLLESRFELWPVATLSGAYALGGERLDPDAGRLLLGKPTPCVGRERELSMLEAIYNECKEEQLARAVLVLGPPGLGKSRLRHEFLRRLNARGERAIVLLGRGDPLKTKSAYGLLGEALRQRLELRGGQSLEEQRARLRERIGAALPAADALRVTVFIGEICGIPFPDAETPLLQTARQDPRIMSDQVEQAWLDGMRLLRTEEPLILVLEDLHWSDALTVKLVGAALRRLRDHALMVLALARPEVQELYPNLWPGAVQPLPLHSLSKKAGERLVRQILEADATPDQVERIVAQSTGNPLFLEELIRAAAEHKTAGLPETVAAMIQSRIGRLPAGTRRLLRAASVFGETFWENGVRSLLAATSGEESIQGELSELIKEEIIEKTLEHRFVTETQYRFRHALVRDAAYGLVSAGEKVAWHAAVGAFMEAKGEPDAGVLAEHFRIGHQLPQAVKCYMRAAEQVCEAGGVDAALVCVERGLAAGAQGVERGTLLGMQVRIAFWQEQFAQVLRIGPEMMSLLPVGGKHWARAMEGILSVTAFTQPQALPQMAGHFLSTDPDPDPEARSAYAYVAAGFGTLLTFAGQKKPATQARARSREIGKYLSSKDYSAWGMIHATDGLYHDFIIKRPYTGLACLETATHNLTMAGHSYMVSMVKTLHAKALFDLGQRSKARDLFRTNLAFTKQLNNALPLSTCRSFFAHLLASSSASEDWQEARELCQSNLNTPAPIELGVSHGILAQVAFQFADLATAESEARTANQILAMFPGFKPGIAVLLSQILAAQGNPGQSLQICEEAMQEQEKLELEPHGLLELFVALAEAREGARLPAAARQAVERALPILRLRVSDIPDSAMRDTYLREVPENVRLLQLAAQ